MNSIQTKIGVSLIAIITSLLIVFGMYQYFTIQTDLTQELNDLAATSVARLAEQLNKPIWDMDLAQVEKILLSYLGDKRVFAILVMDEQGKPLTGKKRNEQWQIIKAEEAIAGNFIKARQEIVQNEKNIGAAEISLTPKFMVAKLRQEMSKIFLTTVVLDIALLLFLTITLRKMLIQPLNRILKTANAIAVGDFSQEAAIHQKDEIGALANAFRTMQNMIGEVLQEMGKVMLAIQEGKLHVRGNPAQFEGDWRKLVGGVNDVIDALMAPITLAAEKLDRISKGDIPEKITQEYKGDFNTIKNNLNLLIEMMHDTTRIAEEIAGGNLALEAKERSAQDRLMQALNTMIVRLNAVRNEIQTLIQAVQQGKLDGRAQVAPFAGGWRDLVAGVNSLVDAFATPITMTAVALDRIARGDIPAKITQEYKGDFNEIKNNLNRLIGTMRNLLNGTNSLIQAVQAGNLAARGNAEEFVGDWRELVIGINNVLEAFVKPITMAAATIDRIARGDVPDPITDEYNGDFNRIKHNLNLLIQATNGITRLAEEIADGNLTVAFTERSNADTLMHALNAMTQRVKDVIRNVKAAADSVATSSQELSASAGNMAEGVSQQAAASEQASSSMEEMTANIKQNADNALQTEKIALQAAEYAEEGGQVVAETVVSMKQIAEKILIIEEIASQTRLLSLNATIEAARAQEHGRAFSVVASEVRKLSDVTKKAAEEINKLATSSFAVSEKAGQMLETLVPSIHRTAELVQEITAASNEQSSGAEQINKAIQQLDQVTQKNAAIGEEIASMAENLAAQAEQLQQAIAFFRVSAEQRSQAAISSNTPYAKGKTDVPKRNSEAVAFDLKELAGEDELDAKFERY